MQQLSNRDLQVLKSLLRRELRELNGNIEQLSLNAKVLYRASDKTDQSIPSKAAFVSMNSHRDAIRSDVERLRKLEAIQKKIKLNLT